jgi:long-chain acyl-CoA synthetase
MLIDSLYAHADAEPDRPALVHGDERLSRADFLDRAERLAAGLGGLGIGRGDAVALLLPNVPEYVISFFAIAGLGGVVVPLNPAFKQEEIDFYLRTCRVRAVIADGRAADVAARIVAGWDDDVPVIATGSATDGGLTWQGLVDGNSGRRLGGAAPDDPIVFQFSSGSTGRPKRVMRTHGQCSVETHMYTAALGITPDDTIFCPIPLFHTYGQGMCLFNFPDSGAALVLLEDPHPFVLKRGRALEVIERERATIFAGVPFNYRLLADAPGEADLSSLRWCYSAGTALPRPAFDAFRERFGLAVRQLYGCTEAGLMTINVEPDAVESFASVGTPAPGVRFAVVDDDGAPLPLGEEGELVVSSPGLTRGYVDMPDVNAQAFRDGFYFTGDLGRIDAQGRVFITGRKKLLIEVAGYKVDPIEVEDVLVAHPKVREAVVVGVRGRVEGEEIVKAAVVRGDDCGERELIEFCQKRLANWKVPQLVEFREEIPKSPLGKILRKYLVDAPDA